MRRKIRSRLYTNPKVIIKLVSDDYGEQVYTGSLDL